jgi:zinc protease
MIRRPLATALAALLALPAAAPADGPRLARNRSPEDAPYKGFFATFPSGLRTVSFELLGRRSTLVAVSYATAEPAEPPGKEGLALVAAKAAGWARPGKGERTVIERLFAAGVLFRTHTSPDELAFAALVRPDRLDGVLRIERERAADPTAGLDDREILVAREDVALSLEVAQQGEAERRDAIVRRVLAGTPYAAPAPTPGSVRAVTPEDVRAWLRATVRPERAVVLVIGPTVARDAAQAVLDTFGPGSPPEAAAVFPALDAPAPPTALARITSPVEKPRLALGWRLPGGRARQTASAVAARIFLEVALEKEVADGSLEDEVDAVGVDLVLRDGAAALLVEADLAADADPEKVRRKIEKAAAKLGSGWSGDWNHRAAALAQGIQRGTHFGLERGEVGDVAGLVRAAGQPDSVAEWRRQLDEQLGPALGRYLKAHVRAGAAAALLHEPTGTPEPLAVQRPPRFERWEPATNLVASAAPGAGEAALLIRPPGLDAAVRRTLPNGLEVAVLPRGAFPAVEVALVVRGLPPFPDGQAAEAVLGAARQTLFRDGRSPARARALVEGFLFTAGGSSAYLPWYLEHVAAWTHARLDEGTLKKWVKPRREAAKRRPRGLASDGAYFRALYPSSGAPTTPDEALAGAAPDAARRLLGGIRPDRATLVIAGNVFATDALWNEIDALFGGWKAPAEPAAELAPAPEPEARRLLLVDFPESPTGAVTVAVRVPPAAARDPALHAIVETALEERIGLLFGPLAARWNVFTVDRPIGAALVVTAVVEAPLAAGAARELVDELEALAGAPVTGAELDLFRWKAAIRATYAADTLDEATAALLTQVATRAPPGPAETLGAALAAVTPEALHAYAGRIFGREVVTVNGPAAMLVPALEEVDLSPVRVPVPGLAPSAAPAR